MKVSVKQAAKALLEKDNIVIISHKLPDGDTLGSATALCYALRYLNKKVNVKCNDLFGDKYEYLFSSYYNMNFKDEYIVTVDIADTSLFGKKMDNYVDIVDLSIDHHESNKYFAKQNLVDSHASATCEIIYEIIKEMNVPLSIDIANSIFTGILTDTGCFRYSNTTHITHAIVGELIKAGATTSKITKALFDSKTRGRIEMEKYILNTMEFFCDNKIAIISLPLEEMENAGVKEWELDGISSVPKTIIGVEIAITIKEKDYNMFKISLRTSKNINASDICKEFEGGGHPRAAGCTIEGTYEEVKKKILDHCKSYILGK